MSLYSRLDGRFLHRTLAGIMCPNNHATPCMKGFADHILVDKATGLADTYAHYCSDCRRKKETSMPLTLSGIWTDITAIRKKSPLIYSITNFIVMNSTANALLALGASPVMAHAEQEIDDMIAVADALAINIGTLSDHWVKSMFRAAESARKRNIPIVIDPVGADTSSYRVQTVRDLIAAVPPRILRGNLPEIMAILDKRPEIELSDADGATKTAVDEAGALSRKHNGMVVCISGETDYIVSGEETLKVRHGHPLMTRVAGMGCTATALCAAFASVNDDYLVAAARAMAVMGIAGEIAAEVSAGSGSMQINFLDTLYKLSKVDINRLL